MWFRNPFHARRAGPPRRRPAARRLAIDALEGRAVPASLSVGDATIVEGNAGTQNALVTVTLSAPSTHPVKVTYRTADGTALAGSDYQAASGRLNFARGSTSMTIKVPVIGDVRSEPNETILVNLSDASHATIADGQGVVTIADDDTRLRISDASAAEGDAGTTPVTFTVTLAAASPQTVTVNYATADGTATTADVDYRAGTGTLTFAPGETTRTVVIDAVGDATPELDETFLVNLSGATNAVILDGQGQGTIQSDEPGPFLTIDDWSDYAGPSFLFTVSLSAACGETVTVHFTTQDGWAIAGEDYLVASGTLTFAPGVTSQSFWIETVEDFTPEPEETFFVNLSGATNAVILDGQGVGTILSPFSGEPPP